MKFFGLGLGQGQKKAKTRLLPQHKGPGRKKENINVNHLAQVNQPPWSTSPGDGSYPRSASPHIKAQLEEYNVK